MKQKMDLVYIQETKKDSFDKAICQFMWGDSSVSWDFVPSIQASGGLLCMWSNSDFQVERRVKGRHFLMLVGKWVKENQWLHIVNVYAPCDQAGKRILWDELSHLKASNPNGLWCVLEISILLEARMRELPHLKGLSLPHISQILITGYLRWSFMMLDALEAILLGLDPMVVPRVALIDFWCVINGYLCGLIPHSMSFKETSRITALSS